MTKDELDALTRFLAERDPEPVVCQFQCLYSEVLSIVKFAMIPAGWLPDPTAFKDPGPAIPVEYVSPRPGWKAQDQPGW